MDEPFAGLDPVNVAMLKSAFLEMRDRGKTLVFSTHQIEQAEALCDSVAIIDHGRILTEGPTREVKRSTGQQAVRRGHVPGLRPAWLLSLPHVSGIRPRQRLHGAPRRCRHGSAGRAARGNGPRRGGPPVRGRRSVPGGRVRRPGRGFLSRRPDERIGGGLRVVSYISNVTASPGASTFISSEFRASNSALLLLVDCVTCDRLPAPDHPPGRHVRGHEARFDRLCHRKRQPAGRRQLDAISQPGHLEATGVAALTPTKLVFPVDDVAAARRAVVDGTYSALLVVRAFDEPATSRSPRIRSSLAVSRRDGRPAGSERGRHRGPPRPSRAGRRAAGNPVRPGVVDGFQFLFRPRSHPMAPQPPW